MPPDYKKNKPPVGGLDYEIKLQTMFALGGFHNFKTRNWKLSNENTTAGKFDDLVFQTDLGDILLQAKHKETGKLNEEQFLSSNPNKDDFSLAKYIISFKTLKSFNIKLLVLCTNSDLNTSLFTKTPVEETDLLHKICDICKVYKIQDSSCVPVLQEKIAEYQNKLSPKHELKSVVVDKSDIEGFLNIFLCITLKDGNMENTIRNRLKILNSSAKFPVASFKYVVDQVQEWYKSKPSKAYHMTHLNIKSILYGEKNAEEIEMFLDETITFKDHYTFKTLNVINLDTTLGVNKVLQSLWVPYKHEGKLKEKFYNETLILNAEGDIDEYLDMTECFVLDKYNVLIVLLQNKLDKHIPKIYDKIRDVINMKPKGNTKKAILIVIGQNFTSDEELTTINDTITFDSFSPETKTEFLKKNIIFQGTSIQLQELGINFDAKNILDECTITKLLNSSRYSVGTGIKQLGSIKDYYIKRTLNGTNESFLEEDILEKCSQKVLVISDQPGSGKSMLIVKLANYWKVQHPQYWILQLDLGLTISYLKTAKNSSLLELLQSNLTNGDYFERQLTNVLTKYIIFDGIDEISENDRPTLLSFIKEICLHDDVARVIVTTRSYGFIIEELNSIEDVNILTIQEFSTFEQAVFFEKYFNVSINQAKVFLKNLPDVLKHFLSIPLYIEMVANIFGDKINDNDILLKTVNIANNNTYELFQLFLEKKKEIFISSKGNCTKNSVLHDILSDCFNRYLEELESLAVRRNITNRKTLDLLDVDIRKTIRNTVLHVGILENINNELRFVHKTFEEYFVAKYLWKSLLQHNNNEKLLLFVYNEIFLNIEQQNVCHFIECILESECPRQYEDMSKKFGNLMTQSTWNENKNILNLAFQGSVNILKLLLDYCEDVPTFINNVGRYGETALLLSAHYLSTIQYLVEKGAIIQVEDNNGFAAIHYAATRMSNFENFEAELSALSKSLHYRYMLFHMYSVHNNLYRYKESDSYMKKLNSNYEKGLVLQRRSDNFQKIIEYFVTNGADLNKKTKIGTTILHYVAYCGLFQEFKFLVKIGADITLYDVYGNNIMHYAVLGGSVDIVKYLYQLNVALNETNLNGVAPIHFTPLGNSLEVVKFFINNNVNIETEDKYGRTALFYVNASTSLDLIKLFVKLYKDQEIPLGRRSKDLRCNVLHTAAFTNAVHIVKYLMEEHSDLYVKDQLGQFPEHYAAEGDSTKVLKYFHQTRNSVTKVVDLDGSTVLHIAAIGNSVKVVKYVVEVLGMDPNVLSYSKKAPVHYAAGSGAFKVIEYFYKYGIDMNIKDKEDATGLHYAAAFGALNIFKYLCENSQLQISALDRRGRHAIHYAAENNSLEILQYLLELGVNEDLIDFNGDTILHRAAMENSITVTKYIFEQYPQLYKPNFVDKYPLHHAVEADALENVKYLIEKGMDPQILLKNKVNLLHLAAGRNSLAVIQFLIKECGMNPKQTNQNGKTCIHFAAEGDSLAVMKYLARIGLNLKNASSDGVTLVHSAALGNAINVLQYLIDMRGLSILKRDHGGRLPIHYASKANAMKAIKYIVQNNASTIYSLDYRDNTVLHFCAEGNALVAFRYFVKECRYDDVNSADVSGKRPIDVAIENDSIDVVKYILSNGINNFIDNSGNTLLHFAVKYDSINVIEYLVNELDMSEKVKNDAGDTPLNFAAQYQSLKALTFFGVVENKKKCEIM